MEGLNVMVVSPVEFMDYKLSKTDLLRGIFTDKLTTAAREIFAVVERTVSGYEEEAAGLRQEIDRQRIQLEALLQPRVSLCRIDTPVPDEEDGGGELPEEEEEDGGGEPPEEEEDGGGGEPPKEEEDGGGELPEEEDGGGELPEEEEEDGGGELPEEEDGGGELPEEEDGGGGELQEEEHQTRVERSCDTFSHAEEEEGETVGEEKSPDEPVKGASRDHHDTRDPDDQIVNTRAPSLKRKSRINLRVCLLKDADTDSLSKCVLRKQVQEVRCPPGLQEADFLDLLRSTFPQLTGQFDAFSVNAKRKLTPLKLQTLTPEEIQRSLRSTGRGRSAFYIREKAPGNSPTNEGQLCPPYRRDKTTDDPRNHDSRSHARAPSLKKNSRINLRVCLLKDADTDSLSKCVLRKQVQEVRCPPGLQEADFLDLLRSTFPQLTGQFDAFSVNAKRKLTPLKLQTLTPEEIQRSLRSTGRGRSAFYIREKAPGNSPTNEGQLCPPYRRDKTTDDPGNHDSRSHASSKNSPVGGVESNASDHLCSNSEQQQVGSEEDLSALPSARSAAVSDNEDDDNEEDEDDLDEEWKPEKDDDELKEKKSKLCPSKTTKKTRVKHSGVKSKRRKQMESPLKASTDNSGVPLTCKVCKALSGSKNMLIKHSWSHVEDPERLCGVCGEQSETPEELRSHLEGHKKTYCCDICGKKFVSVVGFQRHAALHTGEKPYECDICKRVFSLKSSLRNHRLVHVEEKPHKCDVCDKSFAFKQQLRTHSVTHTGEKPYTCDLCGKSVTNLRSLSLHKTIHSGEKRYSCPVCGKSFFTPRHMKEHEKIHTERVSTHLCDVCCKMFTTPGQLKAHMTTHSDEKIMCTVCGKGLSSKGTLSRHMITHSGKRPYKCSECGLSFNHCRHLRNHQQTHSGIKPYVCQICGKAFLRRTYLTVHMRTHNGEKPYKCTVCDRGFTQSHCLKTHMKSHQGEDKSAADGLNS